MMPKENTKVDAYRDAPLQKKGKRKEKSRFVCNDYTIESVELEDKKLDKLVLVGEEVGSRRSLKLSEVRLVDKDDKVVDWGMWLKKDKKGAICYGAVVRFLYRFNLKKVDDVIGFEFPIVRTKRNYWVVDAV